MRINDSGRFNSKSTHDYLQQVIDQYKTTIQNFYVLFIFDELDTQYDYYSLYEQHMSEGSIISLDQNDIFLLPKASY